MKFPSILLPTGTTIGSIMNIMVHQIHVEEQKWESEFGRFRNSECLSAVSSPMTNTSTKHSGMEINAEYSFQLVLRTTAGTFPSNLLRVCTHTMSDTFGICVFWQCPRPGIIEKQVALREMGAKWSDNIQIDTSHFVCTTPAVTPTGANVAGNASGVPGVTYQRALQLTIPILQPHWILACHLVKQ